MTLKNLLLAGALFAAPQLHAQTWVNDSLSMTPGYANDVFYSFKNGIAKTETANNWHLAFQMTPPGPYGNVSVLANHVSGKVKVYSAHLGATANFSTFNAMDTGTVAIPSNEVYNSDTSWNYGAFNQLNDPTDPFDYSWGAYDLTTHNVNGDSLYLINANGTFYKIWLQQFVSFPLDSVQWKFRIGSLDGTLDTTIHINRQNGFTDRLFAYFDINSLSTVDREPSRSAWDVLFTRYKEYIPGAPGSPFYNVTGVLSNFDVTVAEVNNLPADSANLDDQINANSFSKKQNEIGSDWKEFDFSANGFVILDSLSYFVKTLHTNEYYQLQFTGFSGTQSGNISFKKRFLKDALAIQGIHVEALNGFIVSPNPAVGKVSILLDAKENAGASRILLTDLTGKVVYHSSVDLSKGLNAYNLNVASYTAGIYMLSVTNGKWKVTEKLMVQH